MQTSVVDLFTPDSVVRHLALFLLVVAVAMPTVLLIRIVALAAGIVLILLATVVADDPVGLFWAILFVVVNLVHLGFYLKRHWGGPFNAEERLFHERVMPALGRVQTRRLLAAGHWRDVAAGTTLTRQGEMVSELCFISRGTVDVMVDGHKVADVGAGNLIGEVGLSTGDPATATSVCATPVRYLGFATTDLSRVLDAHVDLQDAVELAIQRSLRDKLHHANALRAHPFGASPH